jgi:23S rRNA (uracil1939-C5)-methyltransferase
MQITLTISDVVYPGKGLARMSNGCVVFVPGVLPGEVVRVNIVKQAKNFAEGRLAEVVEASQHRVTPVCPLAAVCPGCRYQHVDYREEIKLKQSQFVNLLERQARVDTSGCPPPISSSQPIEYRNKITLHAAVGKKRAGVRPFELRSGHGAGATLAGHRVLGYFADDNESVIDVDHCPLAMPAINEILKSIRKNKEFVQSLRTNMVVTLRNTKNGGTVFWKGKAEPGKPWLAESTSLGKLFVPRGSFFQINPFVADRLVDHVVEHIEKINPASVIDLYCGAGLFAVAVGARLPNVGQILGIDEDAEAIEAAELNASARRLTKVKFTAAPALKGLKQAFKLVDPKKTALIVDPPRTGLEKGIVELIKAERPMDIVYVSCAADTLVRDMALVRQRGYQALSTRLLDMFPRTPYFESVTHLSLNR